MAELRPEALLEPLLLEPIFGTNTAHRKLQSEVGLVVLLPGFSDHSEGFPSFDWYLTMEGVWLDSQSQLGVFVRHDDVMWCKSWTPHLVAFPCTMLLG